MNHCCNNERDDRYMTNFSLRINILNILSLSRLTIHKENALALNNHLDHDDRLCRPHITQ